MTRNPAPLLDDPFPDPRTADPHGVVCAGEKPHVDLLRIAYGKGIFPWPHTGMPLLWFSPDPRYLVVPAQVHVHRSLRKVLKKTPVVVKADTAFDRVMQECSKKKRPGQRGTWITKDMIKGYTALHREGLAHSVEAWLGDELIGGLYGVSIGAQFCGESMFANAPDASKIAFVTLAVQLARWNFDFIDCQTYTEHTSRFGTVPTPRSLYLDKLAKAVRAPSRLAPWDFTATPLDAASMLHAELPDERGIPDDE